MRVMPTVLPDLVSVTLAVLGGFRGWPAKATKEKGIAECPQALICARCDPATKRVSLRQMKKSGLAELGRLLFGRGNRGTEGAYDVV